MKLEAAVSEMTGSTSPPRSNGELVFEQPWHARAFGLAVGLIQEQRLDWEEFRTCLIDEIVNWEREHGMASREVYSYYDRWAAALERLVLEMHLVSVSELEAEVRGVA